MTSPSDRSSLTSWDSSAYAPVVEFRVLGPVEVLIDGRPVSLGGPKQRHVLALLVTEAGRTISVDRLIEGVWGDEPPGGARGTLQTYVSNLRGALGEIIHREADGYRLVVDRDAVDALRFEDLVAAARRETDPARASGQLRTALALWQGRPFADIDDFGVLRPYTAQLEELRVAALEARVEADLAGGLHLDVVGELEALSAEHPFRERFRAQHMLALYRCGRQAEALRAYERTRTLLADELGIDPSPMLQDVEQRILNHDATLDLEPQVENRAFLFTDLEDSTLLWELHPQKMGVSLKRHDEILHRAVTSNGGRVFKTTGDGVCAVFATASTALAAAELAQHELAASNWGDTGPLKVRMAIDLGDVETRGEDFFGPPLNRCARILASGHGGQVLISTDAHQALVDDPTVHWQVKALGEYRFKGLGRPQSVYQQVISGLGSDFPPLRIDRMPTLIPGTGFGRVVRGYELREQIGGGDFGLVYRAYQPSVGREVAVKVIRPEYVNQAAFVRRFEAEAQLVAQLEHPHVVSLYDYWRDPDGAYLVMRWMRGGSLRQALNRGPWNLEPAAMLLKQIGGAMSYAHRQGVVHRDLKPGNVLLDEEGNGYLSDFGIATRLADPSETRRPISSSPAYLAPEELEGRPLSNLSDIYSLGLLTFELLTGQRPPLDAPLPAVHAVQPKLSPKVDEVIARATADDPAARFHTVDEYLTALSSALGIGADRLAEPSFTPTRNPYKGLVAFKETDAADFYGRDQVTRDLLQAVGERRLVAVVGPSGIGKSSVIRAGLIPALRAGGVPGSREWVITDMFLGSYPYEELEAALLRVAVDRPEGLFDDLAKDERGILRSVKRILPADTEMVLIIDQFEELFTLTVDEQVRTRFLEALVVLLEDARSRVRVVIGLRADFFDRPLRYPRFGELLSAGVFPLVAPSAGELAEAIARPAHNVGVQLEEGLLDEVVADITDQPGALPLLQYALTELFAARTSDTLTVHGYRSTGGVIGAIPRKAEELFAQLDPHEQDAARQVFLRLVAVHEAAADTRRRVRVGELRGLAIDPTALERILDSFGAHRLLTFDRDPVTRGSTVEVAHEAMLTEWGRLRDWIDERREDLLLHRRLTEAAQEWEQSGKEASYLLSGGRLDHFEGWASQTDLLLTEAERTYIADSRQAETERQIKRTRRRRGILGGFAGAAILAIVLAGIAFVNQQRARDAAVEAEQQRAIAATNADTAVRNEQLARSRELAASAINVIDEDPELSVLLALQAADIAEPPIEAVSALHEALWNHRTIYTYQWPADWVNYGLEIGLSPDGELLAIAAHGNTLEVRDTEADERLWSVEMPYPEATTITRPMFSDDGKRLFAAVEWLPGPAEGLPTVPDREFLGVFEWEAVSGSLVRHFDLGPCGGGLNALSATQALVTGPNRSETEGASLCESGPNYSVFLLDLETGDLTLVTDEMSPFSGGATMSSDARFLFWGGGPVPTRVIDLETGEVLIEPEPESEGWWSQPSAISPDGRLILQSTARIEVRDVATGALVAVNEHGATGLGQFNSDGTRAYSLGVDGTVRIWDPLTGRESMALRLSGVGVGGVLPGGFSMARNGKRVAGAGLDTVLVWDIAASTRGELGGVETCEGITPPDSLTVVAHRGAVLTSCGKPETADVNPISVFVFDWQRGEVERVIPDRGGWGVEFLPNGQSVVAPHGMGSIQGGIDVINTRTGRVLTSMGGLCTFDLFSQPRPGCNDAPDPPFAFVANSLAVSPDGSMLAAGDAAESLTVSVWEVNTGNLLFNDGPRDPSRGYVSHVAWSSDGDVLAVSNSFVLRLFRTGSWDVIAEIPVPPAPDHLQYVTPDMQIIGHGQQGIQVLDTKTRENSLLIPAPHEGRILDSSLSGDGSLIASSGADGFVRVWELATGRLVHEISLGDTAVLNVEFADKDHLLINPAEGHVSVMTIDTEELLQIGRDRLTRGFTEAECTKYNLDPCPDLAAIQGS